MARHSASWFTLACAKLPNYFRLYADFMDLHRTPAGGHYVRANSEPLVAKSEPDIWALLDVSELRPDGACLRPKKATNAVIMASTVQVCFPI